jgi:hypothetical protein
MKCSMVMTCNMDMQNWHSHAAWTYRITFSKTWSTDMQQDMKHGQAARTCSTDTEQGHAARTSSIDIQHENMTNSYLQQNFWLQGSNTVAENSSPDRCNRLAPCLALYICTLVVFPTSCMKFSWWACRLRCAPTVWACNVLLLACLCWTNSKSCNTNKALAPINCL